jgi:hypothetical protein
VDQLRPGLPVLNVSKYSVTEAIDVAVPVSDGWKVTGRLSATTTGPFYDIDYYVEQLPCYTIADLRAGLANGRFLGFSMSRQSDEQDCDVANQCAFVERSGSKLSASERQSAENGWPAG